MLLTISKSTHHHTNKKAHYLAEGESNYSTFVKTLTINLSKTFVSGTFLFFIIYD